MEAELGGVGGSQPRAQTAGSLQKLARQENYSPLELPERTRPCQHLDFSLMKPSELYNNKVVLFRPLSLCYSSNRTLITKEK